MAHSTHLVGKCTFQIEVPDSTRAEAIFAIISKVCEQHLPELLDEAFNISFQPTENVLRLDRLVIDLGELDSDDLQVDLIRRLKIQFTEIFQKTILQQAPVVLSPKERRWELLAFFLRSGRFPWWAFESGKDHHPETILSDLLRYHPAETSISLLRILEEPVVVQRFTQQFSPQALQTVLELLFPADWPRWSAAVAALIGRAAQQYPGALSEVYLWQIVVEHLIPGADRPLQPEALIRALLRAGAERLSESPQHVLAQMQAASADNPVLQSALETISFSGEDVQTRDEAVASSPVEALLFFLRQGRLPEESRLSAEELEPTLLAWLQLDPVHARRVLTAINGQVNLGARLARQFSPQALQTVLELLFPADWPRWPAAVAALIGRAAQQYSGALSEVYLWQIVVEHLISGADRPLQPEALIRALLRAGAERLSESPQHVLAQMQAASADHPVLQSALETISFSGEDVQTRDEAVASSPVEALLFFLRQGRLPEESRLSPEDLEPTLLAWLQSDPVHGRRVLTAINGHVNLGARLARQFSPEALQTVLELLFPADWPRWSAAVAALIGRAAQQYPGALSEVYLWQIVVEHLLPGADRPLQPEALIRALLRAGAERLSESPQHVLAQMQAASADHPVLQSALETISFSGEDVQTRDEAVALYPVEALLFFLRQGRLPEESRLSAEELEPTLLAWLQSDPVHARRVLTAINGHVNLGARLAQQFSPQALQTVLELLFPADWPRWSAAVAALIGRAAQQYPGALSEVYLWQIVVEHLIPGADRPLQPEALIRALLRAGAERLSESPQHVLAQMQAASADHPVLQSALETISFSGEDVQTRDEAVASSPVEALLFFLRQGRLPEESRLSAEELEPTLLAWLQSDPVHARRVLIAINGHVNLGARLARQFSPEALQTVLELLFPADWPRWSAAVAALIGCAAQQYSGALSEVYLWQIVVEHLIPGADRPLQPEALILALLRAGAERLSESPQHVLEQMQAASADHPVLQSVLETIYFSGEDVQTRDEAVASSPVEALLFFLRQGRLPEGSQLSPADLEPTLLAWLQSDPVHARRVLTAINGQVNLGARLAQQFSPEALQTVLELLFPADWPRWSAAVAALIGRAAQQYPGALSEVYLWQIVVEHLIPGADRPLQPEALIRALLRAGAERLSESSQHVLAQMKAASADHPVLQSALETISFFGEDVQTRDEAVASSPVEALLFFLRQGRLPEGSQLSPEDLEPTLLAWLQSDPVHGRRVLTAINGHVNLGARLTRQFSLQALQTVLKVLLPDQWGQLSQLIHDIVQAVDKVTPAAFPEAYFWETSLLLVLKRTSPFVNLTLLVQDMIRLIDEKTGGLPGSKSVVPQIVRELQSGDYHLFTRKKVQLAAGELNVSDQDRLDRITAQWYDAWKGLSEEEMRSYGAIERIQHRLTEGSIAWWDTTGLSIVQLFEQLALLPAAALKTALKRIFIQDITRLWLQSLPNTTFEKLLGILWKRDAGFVATFKQMNDMVIGIQQVAFDEFLFRESVLGMALVSQEMNTRQMLYTLIQSAAKAGRRSATEWAQYLNDEKIIPKDTGNLFFRAFREILEAPVSNQAPDIVMATFDQLMSTGTDQAEESPDAILSYSALLESDLAALWHFFQTGALPARAEISNVIELEQILFRLINKHPELAIPFLHRIFARPAATQRLLQYFSPWLYAAIASRLLAPHFETYTSIRDVLFRQFETENKGALQRHFYTYLFHVVADNHPFPGDVARFTEGLIQWLAHDLGQPEEQIWTHLRWMLEKPNNPMGILEKILPALLEQRQKKQKLIRLEEPPQSRILSESETKEEIIVVQNAGLILVAPFLPRLFGTLNLLENQMFTSVEAAVKSVHLLQYLATGLTETPEQSLVFNKVLCGLPLETPIPLRVELSEDEKDLCMSLLKAVLSNWEIMKNSSVVNLRGAFLLREGTLREQPDRWLLHVEKKTYDIVLDYIPWTISMVKLPWMEKRIEIEWKKKS